MTRPIVLGLVSEVLAACNENRIFAIAATAAAEILSDEDDSELANDMPLFMGCTVGTLRDAGRFWENEMLVHTLVASLLESETQRVANPLIRAIDGFTAEDRQLIIRATDDIQIRVVARLVEHLNQKFPAAFTVDRAGDGEEGIWSFFTNRF
jgi:hypothetical protein